METISKENNLITALHIIWKLMRLIELIFLFQNWLKQ